jgi:excisionase family DNA binding protein
MSRHGQSDDGTGRYPQSTAAPAEEDHGRETPAELKDLASHPEPFVTTEALARYWCVSRKQIYKQIQDGHLPALRLGPRSFRIAVEDALAFESKHANGDTANGNTLAASSRHSSHARETAASADDRQRPRNPAPRKLAS